MLVYCAAQALHSARHALRAGSKRRVGLRFAMAAVATPAPAAASPDYEALCMRLKEISDLGSVAGLLGWDEQTMMPPAAAPLRARQGAALAGVVFEKETAAELGQLLERLAATPPAGAWEQANVRDATRSYKRRVALSKDFAQREARLSSEGYQAWAAARAASDWSAFAPVLQRWVVLSREKYALTHPGVAAYDAALDTFERGLTAARAAEIFGELRAGVVPLLRAVRERGAKPDASWLAGEFDVDKQAAVCRSVALSLGFSLDAGRLDVSLHPFTGGAGPSDVRMTTRFKAHDLLEGLTGAIHETGHALYEQARPPQQDGLPAGEALSMGAHESQSLLWERCVGLSLPFASWLLPQLRAAFPQLPADKTPADLYAALHVVSDMPLIRVEADELNYLLHIVLRFELESALMAGTLSVDELPAAWDAKMQALMGVTPPDAARGVLQDVHWSAGAFGYFPTYSLGAAAAVQIFESAREALPGLDASLAAGEFGPLREWLREHVHSQGSLHGSLDALLVAATGKPLTPSVYIDALTRKYTALYRL